MQTQRIAAALTRSLPPDAVNRVPVRARVPETPGRYRLRVTLAQDDGPAFDELDPDNALDIEFNVVPSHGTDEALADFGLYPSEVRDARAADTVEDMVRALLNRPSGEPRGLTLGLISDRGRETFTTAVAAALGCSVNSLRYAVDQAIPDPGDAMLTGAEAVALTLHRAGVGVISAYAGTSELALCDASARLGLLVNGRGDRESLFQAAGASRLRPGNGAAILHAARGLTNAMGALGAARRNEVGTLAVVGMPSTGSAPFLPPHGEPRLIPDAGAFAKSWYELSAVPEDAAERAGAVERLVEALRRALNDVREAPYGPVLFGVPQDVAEKAWVPLSALPDRFPSQVVPLDRPAVQQAANLLAAANRPVALVDDYALLHDGMREALAEFSARTGCAVLQVKYRRGPMLFERLRRVDVPNFLGWYDPGDPRHSAMMAATDLIITVEDRNMYPRVIGPLPDGRKIALTSKPSAVEKNDYLTAGDALVHGDVVGALIALADSVDDGRADGNGRVDAAGEREPWFTEHMTGPGRRGPAVPPEAVTIRRGIAHALGQIAERLTGPVVLVDDSQMFGGLLAEEYDLFPARLRVVGDHGGFVGGGTATATGLGLGEPTAKVICTLGDQGLTNGLQGLVAAVQESAPVTFVICNNGGSVSLRKQSRPQGLLDLGFNRYLDNAAGMRYTDIATTLGIQSRRVDFSGWLDKDRAAERLDAFDSALTASVDHPGPTLIELVLPSDPEFWTGVWITEGFERASTSATAPVSTAGGAGNA